MLAITGWQSPAGNHSMLQNSGSTLVVGAKWALCSMNMERISGLRLLSTLSDETYRQIILHDRLDRGLGQLQSSIKSTPLIDSPSSES
jgi:hypothetical protein